MYDPPSRRSGNFGIIGISESKVSFSTEGMQGPNGTVGKIILRKNGFLEVRFPLITYSQFQYKHPKISTPWLNPIVVCEFPLTFLMLAQAIYKESDISSSVFVQQSYHNLAEGFMLPRGNPSYPFFLPFEDEDIYNRPEPIFSERTLDPDFVLDPNFVLDHEAYELVKEVYQAFRLDKKWIPAFDENRNFVLS